jgi:hypothetical protein
MIAQLPLLPMAAIIAAIPAADKDLEMAMETLLRNFGKVVDIREHEPTAKYFVDGEGFTKEELTSWVNRHPRIYSFPI